MCKQSGVRFGAMGLELPENITNSITLYWTSRPFVWNIVIRKKKKKGMGSDMKSLLTLQPGAMESISPCTQQYALFLVNFLALRSLERRIHVPIATWL